MKPESKFKPKNHIINNPAGKDVCDHCSEVFETYTYTRKTERSQECPPCYCLMYGSSFRDYNFGIIVHACLQCPLHNPDTGKPSRHTTNYWYRNSGIVGEGLQYENGLPNRGLGYIVDGILCVPV